jgi:carbonic anhydrase
MTVWRVVRARIMAELRHVAAWLENGHPALAAFDGGRHPVARAAASAGFGPVDLVEEAHRRGGLDVFGVFYDIPSAAVLRIRPTTIDSLELVSPAPSGGW